MPNNIENTQQEQCDLESWMAVYDALLCICKAESSALVIKSVYHNYQAFPHGEILMTPFLGASEQPFF